LDRLEIFSFFLSFCPTTDWLCRVPRHFVVRMIFPPSHRRFFAFDPFPVPFCRPSSSFFSQCFLILMPRPRDVVVDFPPSSLITIFTSLPTHYQLIRSFQLAQFFLITFSTGVAWFSPFPLRLCSVFCCCRFHFGQAHSSFFLRYLIFGLRNYLMFPTFFHFPGSDVISSDSSRSCSLSVCEGAFPFLPLALFCSTLPDVFLV